MRNELAQLNKQRKRFRGRFIRYGVKPVQIPPIRTFVLEDIQNVEGIILADHLWFRLNHRFESLGELQEGQLVEFDARVTEYAKRRFLGRSDHCRNGENGESGGTDFRLSYPTNVQIVQQ